MQGSDPSTSTITFAVIMATTGRIPSPERQEKDHTRRRPGRSTAPAQDVYTTSLWMGVCKSSTFQVIPVINLELKHLPTDCVKSNSWLTEVVSADFVCFVSPHDQPPVPGLLVLHQLHISCPSLLPLWRVSQRVKAKELCSSARGNTSDHRGVHE